MGTPQFGDPGPHIPSDMRTLYNNTLLSRRFSLDVGPKGVHQFYACNFKSISSNYTFSLANALLSLFTNSETLGAKLKGT